MSRKLRHIDDVGKIMEWTAAMTAINRLLNDINIKEYRDDWRPWRERNKMGKVRKMDIDEEEPTKGMKKIQEQVLPPLMSPTMRTKKIGIKDDGGMIAGENDTWSLKRIKKTESIPTLGLKDRLLKEIKKKEEWKLPTQKVIPPRVQVNFEEIHQLNQLVKEIDVTLQPHEKRKRKKLTKEREAERGDVKDDGQRIPAEIRSFIENEGITHLDP